MSTNLNKYSKFVVDTMVMDEKPEHRAMAVVNVLREHPEECVPGLQELAKLCSYGQAAKSLLAQLEHGPSTIEWFIRKLPAGMAAVTNGERVCSVACADPGIYSDLKEGSPVFVNAKLGAITGICPRDIVNVGSILGVESVQQDGDYAVLKGQTGDVMSMVATDMRGTVNSGDQVVVSNSGNVVVKKLCKDNDQAEHLLTDASLLDAVNPEEIADINPVVDELIFRAKSFVLHADWISKLKVRNASSYLLCGPTGTGKTTAIRVVAKVLMDYVHTITGQKLSRLVVADASNFWSPYFGQSELNIKSWFDGLKRLGKHQLKSLDDKPISVPLIVVIEEGESLFRSRGSHDNSSHLFDRPLSMMLQMASSIGSEINSPIIIIMTSNRPALMDAAALRRFGMRKAVFPALNEKQTQQILDKKLDHGLPLSMDKSDVRGKIMEYLFGDGQNQKLGEFQVRGKKRIFNRRDFITPAILEEAASHASDMALRNSVQMDTLVGVSPDDMIHSLSTQYAALRHNLRPENLEEYVPEWFTD